jgi:hypothetical protein
LPEVRRAAALIVLAVTLAALAAPGNRWVAPDRLEWTLTRTSVDGRLLQTIDGVVSRQGDDAPRDR